MGLNPRQKKKSQAALFMKNWILNRLLKDQTLSRGNIK